MRREWCYTCREIAGPGQSRFRCIGCFKVVKHETELAEESLQEETKDEVVEESTKEVEESAEEEVNEESVKEVEESAEEEVEEELKKTND
ncbi:probable inactive protein kinase DDB_G0270444 isoform X2 [Cajanus cajan]|uniref:probable inactive protein kinase DDB_G0270444 isoform X2 n=1 Tax=Cajanus cajan TaxID=3821 RepID=UPI0010FB47EA|nr:probable inactive protein kinase DDB_G0270444 isoform X2 [Cajanus cajan]